MEHHEPMTTTGSRWSRQCCEFKITHPNPYGLVLGAGGGPLDAPQFIAAGSCNSVNWTTGGRPVPHMSDVERP